MVGTGLRVASADFVFAVVFFAVSFLAAGFFFVVAMILLSSCLVYLNGVSRYSKQYQTVFTSPDTVCLVYELPC